MRRFGRIWMCWVMGSEWKIGLLGNHVDSCLGKMLDKKKNKGEPHPYLGNKSVRWGHFDLDRLDEMPFEKHEHERYGLKYGDLVVCEGGEPGRCSIWKDEVPNMKIQKALHRIRPKTNLDNFYLYYWFLWAGKNDRLEQYFTGTTIKHLTGKALATIELPIPPLQVQKRIARVLRSIDNKIQLNRQTNQTVKPTKP
jgi:type I restriction enzyme S subunit